MPKKQSISQIFIDIQAKLCQWVRNKPTGQFSIHLNFNEGGLRGRPEVIIKEKI